MVDTLTIFLKTIRRSAKAIWAKAKAQIGNSGSREEIMDSNRSGRRRFLKHGAALAGLAVGAERSASGQSAASEATPKDVHIHGEPSHFVNAGRGVKLRIDHMTYYTPLQDSAGIITPASLHFMQQHSSRLPDIDPLQH